jgi:hypothetical protein
MLLMLAHLEAHDHKQLTFRQSAVVLNHFSHVGQRFLSSWTKAKCEVSSSADLNCRPQGKQYASKLVIPSVG